MSAVSILTAVQRVSGSENSAGRGTGSPAHGKERSPPTDWAHGGEISSNFLTSNYKGQNSLNSAFALHSGMFAPKTGTHKVKRLIQIYVGLNLPSHLVKDQNEEEEYALAVIFVSPSHLPVAQFLSEQYQSELVCLHHCLTLWSTMSQCCLLSRAMSCPFRKSCELRSFSWRILWPRCAKSTRCCVSSLNRTWRPMSKQVRFKTRLHTFEPGSLEYAKIPICTK